jgi:hypothetical protein
MVVSLGCEKRHSGFGLPSTTCRITFSKSGARIVIVVLAALFMAISL